MKIAVASPPLTISMAEKIGWLEKLVKQASSQNAAIICFPESYLPGYPGTGFNMEDRSVEALQTALAQVCAIAKEKAIIIICPMDKYENHRWLNVAYVISEKGELLGYQTKNQLDPTEDNIWVPGNERQL